MTQDDLDAIRQRVALTTPGPWEHHYHDAASLDELAAFFGKALAYAPDRLRIELVTTGGPDEDGICSPDAVTTAITGNGPRSVANAEFIANARQDLLLLLGEVAALRTELEKFQTPYYLRLEERNQELSSENRNLHLAVDAMAAENKALRVEAKGVDELCELCAKSLHELLSVGYALNWPDEVEDVIAELRKTLRR